MPQAAGALLTVARSWTAGRGRKNVEGSHHAVVLVLKDVEVEHVTADQSRLRW